MTFAPRRSVFPTSLWVRLRLALLFKKKKYLQFEEFSLFSYGVKPERKRFTTFNQHMFNTGVALDGDLVTRHPELLTGWAAIEPHERTKRAPGAPSAAAIVVHIYYEDTWPDIAEVLKRLTIPFDLIVTTVPGRERLIEAVRRDFPHADIEVMENRGRDVRPFLVLLERGRLDRYAYVCKVHGKKSSDGGRMSYMGSLWRRRLLFDLLAAPGLADSIVERFERDRLDRHDRPPRLSPPQQNLFRGALMVGQSADGARACRADGRSGGAVPIGFLRRNDVLGPSGGAAPLARARPRREVRGGEGAA